jgi:hypothetical protein
MPDIGVVIPDEQFDRSHPPWAGKMNLRKKIRETRSYKVEMLGMLAAPLGGAVLGWLYGAPTMDIPARAGSVRAAELGAITYGFLLLLPLMIVGALVGMVLDARASRRPPKPRGKSPEDAVEP